LKNDNVEKALDMEKLASLCKRRGIIFQSSEIYGGINGFWDYGPLGAELKRNVRDSWWRNMVQRRDNVVGLDASIIMHPRVWEASGHLGGFADPMVDCRACKKRYKADGFCEEQGAKLIRNADGFALPAGVKCLECGSEDLTEPRAFDLMFKTFVGPVQDESAVAYLRPETAQGIFAEARLFATRSTPKTSPSVRASSNRWNSNFSCRPAATANGTPTGWRSA